MLIIVALVMAFCVLPFSSCIKNKPKSFGEHYYSDSYDAISMEDIYLPAGLDLNELGLFWANGSDWVRYDSENVIFDDDKPVIIFAHGMGTGAHAPYSQKWLDAGYNVGCFMWSEFSDDEPFTGQSKVWGVYPGKMRWKSDGKFEKNDVPSHSLAEIYAACYNDFFASRAFSGSEIRIYGHSLGGQLTAALSSYFVSALDTGKMNPSFFPDRITILDPFLWNSSDETYITWLNKTLEDGGSVKATLDTVQSLRAKGAAVEFVRSSPWVEMAALTNGNDGNNYALKKETAYLEIDTTFLPSKYGLVDGIAACHEVGEDWYSGAIDQPVFLDSSEGAYGEYGISPNTSTSYIYARMGNAYALDLNSTEEDYSDDTLCSVNIEKPKIAGFVFLDKNDNGIMDDRIISRISGITVSLYEKGQKKALSSVTTNINGYYEFEAEPGKEYYIKVKKIKGYAFSEKSECGQFNTNGTDASFQSAVISPASIASLIIVNVGLVG